MEERKKIIITKGREFELSYQRQNVDCCQKVFASEKHTSSSPVTLQKFSQTF
jgi:hypothetical protein